MYLTLYRRIKNHEHWIFVHGVYLVMSFKEYHNVHDENALLKEYRNSWYNRIFMVTLPQKMRMSNVD